MGELYKITAYHCRNCGGIVEPGQEICDFCRKKSAFAKYDGRKLMPKARLLIDCDEDFVVFDGITSISDNSEPGEIDITTLGDSTKHFLIGKTEHYIELKFFMRERQDYLFKKLNKSRYKTRIECICGDSSVAFEMDAYLSEFSMPYMEDAYSLMERTMTLIQDGDYRMKTDFCPDNCRCPNCGAIIKSRYGVCDFCSGWIEWYW